MCHLARVKAQEVLTASHSSRQSSKTLHLRFKAIEIHRVDLKKGEKAADHLLASYDLEHDKIDIAAQFPACSHKQEAN